MPKLDPADPKDRIVIGAVAHRILGTEPGDGDVERVVTMITAGQLDLEVRDTSEPGAAVQLLATFEDGDELTIPLDELDLS